MSEATEKRHAKDRAKVKAHFAKKRIAAANKAKAAAPKSSTSARINTTKGDIETFTKPGNKGWKIDTGKQKKTIKAPKAPAKPAKTTHGLGKAGTSTIVDLGKNPTQAQFAKGKAMLPKAKKATAPQATAPSTKRPASYDKPAVEVADLPAKTWKPVNIKAELAKNPKKPTYMMKPPKAPATPKTDEIKIPSIVKKAAAFAGGAIAALGAMKLGDKAGKAIAKVDLPTKAPKVTAATTRKPVTTPKAPKVAKVETPKAPKTPAVVRTPAAPKPAPKVETPKAPKVETPKAPKVYETSKPVTQQPKVAIEAVERADKRAKFQPPPLPKTETPKVEAPKPRSIPVGASPKEVAAIEEAASRQLVGTKPEAPAEPKAGATSKTPAPPKQAAAPKAPEWSATRRKESLTSAREARKAGNVKAMEQALKDLPPSGKKAASERVNLEAGIKSAGSRPVGVVSTALTARKTRKQAKAAGKQAGAQEKTEKKQQKITAEGGEAAEVRASKEAVGKTPALPEVEAPAKPKAPAAPKPAPGPSTTVVKQATSQIEAAAASVEGNKAIYVAARKAQKSGSPADITKALESLPKGTKKTAKLTETLNAALKSAANKPKTVATPGPAIGNNAVTKVDGITTPEISERDKALKAKAEAPADVDLMKADIEEAKKRQPTGRTKSQDQKIKREQRSQQKDQKKAGVTVKDPKTGLTVRPYEVPERIAAEPLDADTARQADADNKRANERAARLASEADIAGAAEGFERGIDQASRGGRDVDRRTAADIVGEAEVEARTTKVEPGKAAGSDSADWQRGRSAAPEASIAEPTAGGQIRPNADFELKLELPGGKKVPVKVSTPSPAIGTAVREVTTPGEGMRLAESRAAGKAPGLTGREASMTDAAQDRRLLALEATGLLNPANETDVSTRNEAQKIVTEARETQRSGEDRRKAPRRTAMDAIQQDIAKVGQDVLGKARDDRERERRSDQNRRQADETKAAERYLSGEGEYPYPKGYTPDPIVPQPTQARSTGEGAKAVEAQADKILEDAGYRKMHDPLTETEAEERVRTRTELLEETRRASMEASDAVKMGDEQVKNRADIVKQQAERAKLLPKTPVGGADLPTPRTVNQGLGYVYQPHTAEMAEQTRAASKRRARLRGAVEGQHYGTARVPDLTAQGAGQRASILQAPEGRPGHVPRPTRTDRRQGEFSKPIDTITPKGQATVQERYAKRQAAKAQAPLTSPAIPGSTAKTPAAPYTGTEGVKVRGTGAKIVGAGRSAVLATAIFAAMGAAKAGAEELYGGEGGNAAAKAAAKELASASPGVALDLATFTAADVAATRALPAMAEGLARKLGDAIARRTAQGTAGRTIANAILKSAGLPTITKLATVRGVAATVGKGGIAGWIAPSNIEAAKTAAEYSQIPRQNRQAVEDAESNKKNMERLYGTVERATRTRKGLDPDTGKRISLDDAGAFAEDMLTEITAREERANKLRDAQKRRPRGI